MIRTLDALLIQVLECESAARGYVLSGEASQLVPYYDAERRLDQTLRSLESQLAESPVDPKLVASVRVLVAEKLAFQKRYAKFVDLAAA